MDRVWMTPPPSGFPGSRPAAADSTEHRRTAPDTMYQEFHAEDCGNCWLMAQGSDKPYYCNKKSCDD